LRVHAAGEENNRASELSARGTIFLELGNSSGRRKEAEYYELERSKNRVGKKGAKKVVDSVSNSN